MVVRWHYVTNFWESLYYVGAGFSLGLSLNAQFVGLTAAAPEDRKGAAIGVYYLSQEMGMILGIGSFAAILENIFGKNLNHALKNLPKKAEVRVLDFSCPSDTPLDDPIVMWHAKPGYCLLGNRNGP